MLQCTRDVKVEELCSKLTSSRSTLVIDSCCHIDIIYRGLRAYEYLLGTTLYSLVRSYVPQSEGKEGRSLVCII
jgi:hypothetical protein